MSEQKTQNTQKFEPRPAFMFLLGNKGTNDLLDTRYAYEPYQMPVLREIAEINGELKSERVVKSKNLNPTPAEAFNVSQIVSNVPLYKEIRFSLESENGENRKKEHIIIYDSVINKPVKAFTEEVNGDVRKVSENASLIADDDMVILHPTKTKEELSAVTETFKMLFKKIKTTEPEVYKELSKKLFGLIGEKDENGKNVIPINSSTAYDFIKTLDEGLPRTEEIIALYKETLSEIQEAEKFDEKTVRSIPLAKTFKEPGKISKEFSPVKVYGIRGLNSIRTVLGKNSVNEIEDFNEYDAFSKAYLKDLFETKEKLGIKGSVKNAVETYLLFNGEDFAVYENVGYDLKQGGEIYSRQNTDLTKTLKEYLSPVYDLRRIVLSEEGNKEDKIVEISELIEKISQNVSKLLSKEQNEMPQSVKEEIEALIQVMSADAFISGDKNVKKTALNDLSKLENFMFSVVHKDFRKKNPTIPFENFVTRKNDRVKHMPFSPFFEEGGVKSENSYKAYLINASIPVLSTMNNILYEKDKPVVAMKVYVEDVAENPKIIDIRKGASLANYVKKQLKLADVINVIASLDDEKLQNKQTVNSLNFANKNFSLKSVIEDLKNSAPKLYEALEVQLKTLKEKFDKDPKEAVEFAKELKNPDTALGRFLNKAEQRLKLIKDISKTQFMLGKNKETLIDFINKPEERNAIRKEFFKECRKTQDANTAKLLTGNLNVALKIVGVGLESFSKNLENFDENFDKQIGYIKYALEGAKRLKYYAYSPNEQKHFLISKGAVRHLTDGIEGKELVKTDVDGKAVIKVKQDDQEVPKEVDNVKVEIDLKEYGRRVNKVVDNFNETLKAANDKIKEDIANAPKTERKKRIINVADTELKDEITLEEDFSFENVEVQTQEMQETPQVLDEKAEELENEYETIGVETDDLDFDETEEETAQEVDKDIENLFNKKAKKTSTSPSL